MAVIEGSEDPTNKDAEGLRQPGKLTGRVFVRQDGGLIRVGFADVVMNEPIYHTVIIVSPEDAVLFGDLIARIGLEVIQRLDPPEPEQPYD